MKQQQERLTRKVVKERVDAGMLVTRTDPNDYIGSWNASRATAAVAVRALASWLIRGEGWLSYPEIGHYIRRNHSSVFSAVRRLAPYPGPDTPEVVTLRENFAAALRGETVTPQTYSELLAVHRVLREGATP